MLVVRSRRGSRENILDSNTETGAQETPGEVDIINMVKEEAEEVTDTKETDIRYFLHVSVAPGLLERKLRTHPGVEEALVRGVPVRGVGQVRAGNI